MVRCFCGWWQTFLLKIDKHNMCLFFFCLFCFFVLSLFRSHSFDKLQYDISVWVYWYSIVFVDTVLHALTEKHERFLYLFLLCIFMLCNIHLFSWSDESFTSASYIYTFLCVKQVRAEKIFIFFFWGGGML